MFIQKLKEKKYQNCSLPYEVWNNENRNFYKLCGYYDGKQTSVGVCVYSELVDALNDSMLTELYYSFNIHHECHCDETKCHCEGHECHCEDQECHGHEHSDHQHEHDFESVVNALYHYPESFYLTKEDEQWYSKQELDFLKRTQKYLLYIGRKDTEYITKELCENEQARNLLTDACYRILDKKTINNIINGKQHEIINTIQKDWSYEPNNYKMVLMDKDYNLYATITLKARNKVSFKEFAKMDIDYKIHGFNSMNDFIQDIKDNGFDEKNYLIEIYDIVEINDVNCQIV